jgi:hypothetical protein
MKLKSQTAGIKQSGIFLILFRRMTGLRCNWCGQALQQCGLCKGSGLYKGSTCELCKGQGRLCPTHEGSWEG